MSGQSILTEPRLRDYLAAGAEAFADELSTASARRMLGWFVITGPLVGMWWLLLLQPHPLAGRCRRAGCGDPGDPRGRRRARDRCRDVRHHRPPRALAARDRPPPVAVIAVGVLVVGADAAVIAFYLGSGLPARPIAMVAVAASVIRSGCCLGAVRHAAALHRRLTNRTGHDAHR